MADRNIFDVNLNDESSDVPVNDQSSASSSDHRGANTEPLEPLEPPNELFCSH